MTASTATDDPVSPAAPKRQLTLFDSTCIIVGIIIGAGIYESTPLIAGSLPGVWWLLGVWLLGGLLSLVGALCYAELATAYPKEGGDYVYLTQAFGRPIGFLFAWAQLWVVRPGSIGAMAYVFGRYANQIWPRAQGPLEPFVLMLYAMASIMVLTDVNTVGVREGKWTQNLLTTCKVLALAAIYILALYFVVPKMTPLPAAKPGQTGFGPADFGFAMIMVLFTYGGWNEMAYVGAELRNPKKNILRALVLGTIAVTLIYLLVSVAFVHAVGFEGTRKPTVAADVVGLAFGEHGARAISLLICISALGAINGQIFTGARIYYAMGKDYRLFSWLGQWDPQLGTPAGSLRIQERITLVLIVGFGFTGGGFANLVKFTTPVFWIFFLLVGISLFVLRYREPQTPRPYRVPAYPLIPIIFCLSSLYMVYASLSYAIENRSWEALWSLGLLLIGGVICLIGWLISRFGSPEKPGSPIA